MQYWLKYVFNWMNRLELKFASGMPLRLIVFLFMKFSLNLSSERLREFTPFAIANTHTTHSHAIEKIGNSRNSLKTETAIECVCGINQNG